VIQAWIDDQPWLDASQRPEPIKVLYETLVREHGFSGSYKAVQRFVRRRAPRPAVRPVRRIETRPGAQAQVDWGTRKIFVHELGGVVALKAFNMTLSHARLSPVRFYTDETQLSWLDAHNHALRVLGGVPVTMRIDNLKTGVKRGAGAWSVLNDTYAAYAQQVGFHVDPARPGKGSDKGKVERRIRDLVGLLVRRGERFITLDDLNHAVLERMFDQAKQRINPATGNTIFEAWLAEQEALQPLPNLPTPFDVHVTRSVPRDCLVHFEGRQYAAPYPLTGQAVHVRGAPGRVEILANGAIVKTYPRHTDARVLIDDDVYDEYNPINQELLRTLPALCVRPPTPLGRVGRAITSGKSWEAAARPLAQYEALLKRKA
jgi:transposase